MNNREKWLRLVKTGVPTANVIDTNAFQTLVRVSRKAKIVGRSTIAFQVVLDVPEVIKTYHEGGDWFKEMVEDAGGLGWGMAGGVVGTGLVTELMLTPMGWVVILGGVAGAFAFEKLGEYGSGAILDTFREAEHVFALL